MPAQARRSGVFQHDALNDLGSDLAFIGNGLEQVIDALQFNERLDIVFLAKQSRDRDTEKFVEVRFEFVDERTVRIETTARVTAKTGVEMEALAAATVAGLTIYDMCKAIDRGMRIEHVQLDEKRGGKSGVWLRNGPAGVGA